MSEKRCGNCKHWGAGHNEHEDNGASIDRDDTFKPCGAVIQVDKFVADCRPGWRNTPSLKDELEAVRVRKAVVVDGSDYFAALKTQEDYGCVLWEPRSTAT